MIMRNTILFTIIASANAQGIVPSIFNTVSSLFFGIFNDLVGTALESFDPFELDFATEVPLGSTSVGDCNDVTTTADFTIKDLSGLSTLFIEQLEMNSFCFGLPELGLGFDFESKINLLTASFEGSIIGDGCGNKITEEFTGSSSLTNVDFHYSFTSDMTIDVGFSLNEINITAFDLTWDNLTVEFSDLGDLNGVAEELTDALVSSCEEAISSLVNASLLQDAIDVIVPFSIP